MQIDFIIVAERGRNAALSVLGGRFPKAVFRYDEHRACLGKFDCSSETGDTGPDHQVIGADRICLIVLGFDGDSTIVQRVSVPSRAHENAW
jgi:hypothetical protein